jgi:D-3-phosphoglycerate dehydrogenase
MSESKRILITCPPFVNQKHHFLESLESAGIDAHWAESSQQLSEDNIVKILPNFDGWILGDDPCSRNVIKSGKAGKLKAIVKWGVGTDNIDFEAIKEFRIKFANTPGMFGNEVADIAMAYLTMISRKILIVHDGTKSGRWLKPVGVSLAGKRIAIVGFGDIGKNIAKRAIAAGLKVFIYESDPKKVEEGQYLDFLEWPVNIEEMDFVVLACSLNSNNRNMMNKSVFDAMKDYSYLVNVSRGGLVDESALVESLQSGKLAGAALDVFEFEPLNIGSALLNCENIVLGSHNASNTIEAVDKTSHLALKLLTEFLVSKP